MDKAVFLLIEGMKNLWRHKLTAFTAIFSVFLSLFLIGSLFVINKNSYHLIEYFRSKYKIEVFFKESVSNQQARRIAEDIRRIPGVHSVTLITKENALRIFKSQFGEDLMDMLGYNPLPSSTVVNLVRTGTEQMDVEPIVRLIQSMEGIDSVYYQGTLIRKIERFYQRIIQALLVTAGGILFITVLVISNTIKLTIYARSDMIKTLKLIGATNLFIKIPIILEGILQGVIGACLAYFVLIGIVEWGNYYISKLVTFQIQYDLIMGVWLIGISMIISLVGSHRATSKFL